MSRIATDRSAGHASDPPRGAASDETPALDLATIYRQHHRLVHWLVRCAGLPEHAIDDVVQDVFVAIHRRASEARHDDLRRWVMGVTRSVCHGHRRSHVRRQHRLRRIGDPEPARSADELLDERAALARLRRALVALDPCQREAFVLIDLEGESAPDVARSMGANLSTIYSRLRLARQRIRAEFVHAPDQLARAQRAGCPSAARARRTWAAVLVRVHGSTVPLAASPIAALGGPMKIALALSLLLAAGLLVRGRGSSTPLRPASATVVADASGPTRTAAVSSPASGAAATSQPGASPAEVPHAEPPLSPAASPSPGRSGRALDRSPVASPSPSPSPSPSSSSSSEPAPASSLEIEAELLRGATQRLDAADPQGAAALLDAHARRFPAGELADERRRLQAAPHSRP